MADVALCPKCGFTRQPGREDCPACGIVFARYDPARLEARRATRATETAWAGDASGEINPYQAPSADVAGQPAPDDLFAAPLASRGSRLGAHILDNVFLMGAFLPGLVPLAFLSPGSENIGPLIAALVVFLAALGTLLGINLRLLGKYGQTLGKKVLGVRIVRLDGDRASLGRLLLLRMFVPWLLAAIPFLGYVFSLLDALFIFRDDRRCIHDHLADTKVILA
jgi:uncharacterized RDD family membrane protein YckC